LALTYHLVSPYTSLVAVDRTPDRPAGTPSNSQAIPLTAPAGSAWANVGYPAGATDARWHLWIGCALLLLGLAMVRRRQWTSV
jgi:Ca-activated chloride channel homolog